MNWASTRSGWARATVVKRSAAWRQVDSFQPRALSVVAKNWVALSKSLRVSLDTSRLGSSLAAAASDFSTLGGGGTLLVRTLVFAPPQADSTSAARAAEHRMVCLVMAVSPVNPAWSPRRWRGAGAPRWGGRAAPPR